MFDLPPSPDESLKGDRLRRVRNAMADRDIDILIAGSPENVLYISGYESMPAAINRRHDYVAIVTENDLLLVCPANDLAAAVGSGLPVTDIYPYGTFFFSGNQPGSHNEPLHGNFGNAFETAMRRLEHGKVALESEHFPDSARRLLPSSCDTTGKSLMLSVRAVKTPAEISVMRAAARMTEEAIEAGIAAAAPGVTDKQIAAVVAAHMSANGGFTRNVTVVGGLHSAYSDAFPAAKPLREGDLLRFDVGCSYYGYKSDLARTAVVGPATALQRDRYAALLDGLIAEFDAMRAGVPAKEVFKAGMDRIHACGFKEFRRHHLGHAIGLAVYEHPVITPDCADKIELGSVFCLETPYYEPGWGGMMCEDTGVVTADGFELMSSIDRSLREID